MSGWGGAAKPPAHNGPPGAGAAAPGSPAGGEPGRAGSLSTGVDPRPGPGGQAPQGDEPAPGVVVEGVAALVGGQVGPVQRPLGPAPGDLAAAGRELEAHLTGDASLRLGHE